MADRLTECHLSVLSQQTATLTKQITAIIPPVKPIPILRVECVCWGGGGGGGDGSGRN